MKRILLASAAILASWAPTLAANLPTKAPAVVPVAAYSWTGFYVGANLGGGWASATTSDRFFVGPNGTGPAGPAVSFSNNLNGLIGGGQIGYNWQTYRRVKLLTRRYSVLPLFAARISRRLAAV
jgi:outer membrane immunogenic protein